MLIRKPYLCMKLHFILDLTGNGIPHSEGFDRRRQISIRFVCGFIARRIDKEEQNDFVQQLEQTWISTWLSCLTWASLGALKLGVVGSNCNCTLGGKFSSVHKASKHFDFGKRGDTAESLYVLLKLSLLYNNFFGFHIVVGLLTHTVFCISTTLITICFSCERKCMCVCKGRQDLKCYIRGWMGVGVLLVQLRARCAAFTEPLPPQISEARPEQTPLTD